MSFEALSPAALGGSLWVQGVAAFVLWVVVLLVARTILLATMRRVAARTRWTWDDVLVEALSPALVIAIFASGLVILGRILPLSKDWDRAFDVMLAAAVVGALILFADRLFRGLLDRLAARSAALQGAQGLLQAGARGLVVGIGALVFLDSIGISITPILASLGVGSLAVALALQDTLANLFAGVYMIMDKPIEAGQFVRLPTGEEGRVARLGWRSTWIRMPPNTMLIVPNARLAGNPIVNFDLPTPDTLVAIPVGVHYDSDLDHVERVTLEVANATLAEAPGGPPGGTAILRFVAFEESSIRLDVVLRARDIGAVPELRHDFMKRLRARYRREGIVMPYPTRTIDLPRGDAGALAGLAPGTTPGEARR